MFESRQSSQTSSPGTLAPPGASGKWRETAHEGQQASRGDGDDAPGAARFVGVGVVMRSHVEVRIAWTVRDYNQHKREFDAAERMNPMQPPLFCGARTRQGHPCGRAALRGRRRCRLHGGLSTGPRTAEGLARSRRARWIHGRYSVEAQEARVRSLMMQPSTEDERRATMRRFAREDAREARRIDAAVRRVLGPA